MWGTSAAVIGTSCCSTSGVLVAKPPTLKFEHETATQSRRIDRDFSRARPRPAPRGDAFLPGKPELVGIFPATAPRGGVAEVDQFVAGRWHSGSRQRSENGSSTAQDKTALDRPARRGAPARASSLWHRELKRGSIGVRTFVFLWT